MVFIFVCGWCKGRTTVGTLKEMDKMYCSKKCEDMSYQCGRCGKRKHISNVIHGVRLCTDCYRKVLL